MGREEGDAQVSLISVEARLVSKTGAYTCRLYRRPLFRAGAAVLPAMRP